MDLPLVETANKDQKQRVLQIATLAFSADPFMRWVLPTAEDFLLKFPAMIDLYCCEESIKEGSTYITNQGGTAIWLSPESDSNAQAVLGWIDKNIEQRIKEEFLEVLAAMDEYHPHDTPCWYLAVIGVDNAYQGQGLGAALMKHATEKLDDAKTLGYLESSNPKNVSLYQRHGFEVMGEIQIASSPIITPMVRYPR